MGRRSRQKRERRMAEHTLPQEPSTGSRDKYTPGDRLAIALACLAGIMAIILFLVNKTPLVVIWLLAAMMAFAVYPAIHFFKSPKSRIFALVTFAAFVVLFGVAEWPKPKMKPPQSALLSQPIPQSSPGTNPSAAQANATAPTKPKKHPAKPPVNSAKQQPCPPGSGLDISNNTASNNGAGGIRVEGVPCLTMHGNVANQNKGPGIEVVPAGNGKTKPATPAGTTPPDAQKM